MTLQFLYTMYVGSSKPKIVQSIVVYLVNDISDLIFIWLANGSLDAYWTEMAVMKVLLFLALVYPYEAAVVTIEASTLNERPIIGILSQEQSMYLHTKYPEENFTSYIAASYVKDVESAGARVVPIMIGRDRSYYQEIMEKLNGVLIPGGATYFNQSDGYADAGQHIYEIAMEMNDAGDYFPIFGTCLGFELLVILASGRGEPENRIRCYSYANKPIDFTDDFRTSKMFKDAPEDIIDLLAHEDVTVNAHQFCIVDENLKSHNLTEDWRVTAYGYDEYGVQFIAAFEHTRYPFYGVQFHPEKIAYEWKLNKNFPHGAKSLKANRYFMDFFNEECKRSPHSFKDAAEENAYLIYNYPPYFTGVLGSAFHQCYLFEPRGTVSNTK